MDYRDPGLVRWFADKLEFDNWAFLLDTGHLMNSIGGSREEVQATEKLVDTLQSIPDDLVEMIVGVHLNHSLSGDYLDTTREEGDPPGYSSSPLSARMNTAIDHFKGIDQHLPFTCDKCRDILAKIRPEYVTHEFPSFSPKEYARKVSIQRAALHPM